MKSARDRRETFEPQESHVFTRRSGTSCTRVRTIRPSQGERAERLGSPFHGVSKPRVAVAGQGKVAVGSLKAIGRIAAAVGVVEPAIVVFGNGTNASADAMAAVAGRTLATGGGGGGQQPREQHPPQPPPPSNAPVFGDLPNPSRFNDLAALETLAKEISSGGGEPIWLNEIYAKNLAELTAFAREVWHSVRRRAQRKQLLTEIFKFAAEQKRPLRDLGYIDLNDRGAFVVHEHVNYRLYPEDPYLPESLIKRYGLKRGHRVEVTLQAAAGRRTLPFGCAHRPVMGMPADEISKVTPFEELVPYYPLQRILLEDPRARRTSRCARSTS